MLLLTSTSDKIQVVTGSAVAIDVHASYVDLASGTVTAGRANTKITTATTTDVVASPAASTTRNIKALFVSNVHASSSNTVTIQHTDGTNVVQLESVTLLAGERIAVRDGVSTRVVDASGMEKVAPIAQGQYTVQRLSTTVTNSTTTAAKVTGLDLVCGPGTWVFEYYLRFQSATATVGPKLSVNHSGTVTSFMYEIYSLTGLTTDSLGVLDQDATTFQVVGGMAARAKGATGTLIGTAGVDTINSDVLIQVNGLAVVTVGGNMELYHGSETATSTSIMSDSALRLTKVG